jgi:hypothetical protein
LATSTALATGNYYQSQTTNGCESARSTAVAVTVNATPGAPSPTSIQAFCSADNPTVASLATNGTSPLWYAASSGGVALATSTALATGNYYQSQTTNGCESARSTAVAVTTSNFWIGTTNGDWNTPTNWSCGSVPASGENILFSSTAANHLTLDQHRSLVNVDFNGSSKNIVLGDFNLTTTGAISNYSANSYVKSTGTGKLTTTIANGGTFIFPIGNISYNPLSIKNTTGATDVFSVRVQDAVYINGASGATVIRPHVRRTWDISKNNPNALDGVDLQFNWDAQDESGSLVDPKMYHHTGSAWEIPTNISSFTAGANTFSVVGYRGTFSPFAIAGESPLPIELLDFTAVANGSSVDLKWTTASEINNDYFTVERSIDAIHFEDVLTKDGAGNSSTIRSYSDVDTKPLPGLSYYRLRQTDFNGSFSHSKIVPVQFDPSTNLIHAFVNNDQNFQLQITGESRGELVNVSVFDLAGKLILDKDLGINKGANSFIITNPGIVSGVYLIRISGYSQQYTKKLFVK